MPETTPTHVVLFETPDETKKNYHSPVVIDLGNDLVSEDGAMQAINNILRKLKETTNGDVVTRVTLGGVANTDGFLAPGKNRVSSMLETKDVSVHPILRVFIQGVKRNEFSISTGNWQSPPGVAGAAVWSGNSALTQYRANVKLLQQFVSDALAQGIEEATVNAQVAPIVELAKQNIPAIIAGAKKYLTKNPEGMLPQDVRDLMD